MCALHYDLGRRVDSERALLTSLFHLKLQHHIGFFSNCERFFSSFFLFFFASSWQIKSNAFATLPEQHNTRFKDIYTYTNRGQGSHVKQVGSTSQDLLFFSFLLLVFFFPFLPFLSITRKLLCYISGSCCERIAIPFRRVFIATTEAEDAVAAGKKEEEASSRKEEPHDCVSCDHLMQFALFLRRSYHDDCYYFQWKEERMIVIILLSLHQASSLFPSLPVCCCDSHSMSLTRSDQQQGERRIPDQQQQHV